MPCPSVARPTLPCPATALPCQSVAPTGRAVMGYRDDQPRLTPVAGNYIILHEARLHSTTVGPLALRGESGHCQSRSGYCQIPQTSLFYLEHGQPQQPGYTQSNSMFVPSKVTYHLANIAPILRSNSPLPETNQTGTVTSSSRFATSRRPALSPWRLVFPLILYSYRHMVLPSPRNSSHNRSFPAYF